MKFNLYAISAIILTLVAFVLLAFQFDTLSGNLHTNSPNAKQDMYSEKELENMKHNTSPLTDTVQIASPVTQYQQADAYTIVDVASLSDQDISDLFSISKIPDSIFQRMLGKSYPENCSVPRAQLRYVRVLHHDGAGHIRIGELVVNKSIAKDVKTIFYKLYQKQYPIEKMVLVDHYDADDNASMADNNTSSFNYRVVEGTTHLSRHSLGLAIDLNPRYNPYIHTLNGKVVCSPENGTAYTDRSKEFPYKIHTQDTAYLLFRKYGFSWGGAWNHSKDYQHFQIDE